jgi:hypothetical protein
MKSSVTLLFLLILVSCGQKISETDIGKLNGYWEIEKVIFSDGKAKEYPMNESFDYIQIKEKKGFRKKVIPQLNGRFLTTNQSEEIQVVFENGTAFINYSTPYAKWKEEIKTITSDRLILVNLSNVNYYYKKAGPINLTENGKETK